MSPPVLLYQLDEPYAKKYKWDKLDWKILSADDIDDFDKVSEFFGHNLKAFYQLYIGDTYAEKCDSFLDACKAQGFTAFLSIVVYGTYGLRRQYHGTHYIVACKENDKKKLSYYLEQITKKKPVVDNIEPSECYIMENYRATKYISLRRFFNDIDYDSNDRLEILLSGYAPRPSILSEKVIKRNLLVARNAKRLERFIASRLNEQMAGTDQPYYFETIEETYNLLKSKLQYLTNATPPLEIKEAQQALNIQLRLFNEAFRYYLQSSEYADQMLTKLDGIIKTVTYVVKALDYGMNDGTWCIVSGCHITNNATNKSTLFIPGYQEHKFADMFPIGSYIAYETKFVQQTNQDNDYFIKFGENKTFPVSFVHVTTPPAQPIAPDELEIDTFYFTAPCSCRPTKKYHWICSSCQAIVREKPNGQVLCSCGVLEVASFKQDCPSCFVVQSTAVNLERAEKAWSVNITWKGYSEAKITAPTFRAKRQHFNILVVGASGAGKSTLLNSINCMERFKSFDDAARNPIPYLLPPEQNNSGFDSSHMHQQNTNESYARPGQSVTQRPKDYLVKFRDYNVNFIDTPGVADTRGVEQDALNLEYIRDHIVDLPYLNGIMFVIKNTETKLSPEFENVIRSLYGLLPRSAVHNCCFVYTFSSAEGFNPGSAQKPLTTLLNTFQEQHNVFNVLTVDNQFCVDNAAWRHLTKTGDQYIESLQGCWNASKEAINELLDYIDEVAPVKQKDLQIVASLSRLDDTLVNDFRRDRQSFQTRQIMASIAERCMTGKAIYFRNNKGDATQLQDNQWNTVAEGWQHKHPELVDVVRMIQALLDGTPFDVKKFNECLKSSNTTPLPNSQPREQQTISLLDGVLPDFNKTTNYPSEHRYAMQQDVKLTSAHQSTCHANSRLQNSGKPPATPRVPSMVGSSGIWMENSVNTDYSKVRHPTSPTHKTQNPNDAIVRRQKTPLSYHVTQHDAVEGRHKPDNTPAIQQSSFKTEKNVYNVLVLSASQETLTALYENIKLIHEPQTHDHVQVTDERPNGIGFSYIVGFGSFSIRFINETVEQIPEAQVELAELVKNYYCIHGFVLLTKGNEHIHHLIEVLTTTLPTRARKQNIYFVNVFAFWQNEASDEPPTVKTVFNIFDEASWKALRQQADSDRYDKHVSSMEAGIHQFTETIKTVRPVTFSDMKFVTYLKRLAAELRTLELSPFNQRLWATIDAHTIDDDDDAKKKKLNAKPLDDYELLTAAEYLQGRNEKLSDLLRKICAVKQNSSNNYRRQ